ncbi:sugar kinase [Erysipelotrichaceae bacterium MTC7]|nr:sugar kinase [Erysipelotrichaceae bacterium MTC7]
MHKKIACFDIGGTLLKCAIIDETGTFLEQCSYPWATSMEELLEHMETFMKGYDVFGIAISCCGPVDTKTSMVKGSFSQDPNIEGFSWKELMDERFGLPCEIENDANCCALGELYFGTARDVKNMCFMVIGTGVGGAIVVDGNIVSGNHLYGGEFGVMLVHDKDGKLTNYSRIASTSSMVFAMEKKEPGVWDGKRIFLEARKGNQNCQAVIADFYDGVALGVFNLQHMIDPEMIVFGGGISEREDFIENVKRAYDTLCAKLDFPTLNPNLKTCTYFNDGNLLGALANFMQKQA